MRRLIPWLVAAIALVTGCRRAGSPGPADAAADADADGGDASFVCPAGLQPASDGRGCVEIAAAGPCPAGTAPFLGSTTCQPVGWITPCPAGMKADPTGWGCIDVSTSDVCSDTTTEALGQTGCVPVGDCSGAFPPAGATLFVDATFTPAQLDATHFLHVADAVAAASSGAVIAIAPGAYVEDIAPKVPLSLVGRCASMVSLVNPGDANAGILVAGVAGVTVSGMTLRGHHQGVSISQGGTATITDSIVIANEGAGVRAVGSGSAATLTRVRVAQTVADAASMLDGWGLRAESGAVLAVTDSAVAGNMQTGISLDASSAMVTGTLIVGTVPGTSGTAGQGIVVSYASTLTLESSAIVGCHSSGLTAQNVGSDARIHQSVVRGTLADGNGYGQGIGVANGASVELVQSLVAETLSAAVLVDSTSAPGAIATLTSSVLRGPLPARAGSWGPGAQAQNGGELQVHASAVVGTSAVGLGLTDPGTTGAAQGTAVIGTVPATVGGTCAGVIVQSSANLALHGSSVVGNSSLGLSAGSMAGGGTVTADGLLVQGTHPDSQGNFGSGAQCTGQGTLTLSGSALVGNAVDGLSLAENSKVSLTGTVVRASVLDPMGHFGYGIIASNTGILTLGSSFVRDNPGIGLTFSDSMGTVSSTWVANNAVGILVQSGSFLTVGGPTAPLATGEVRVSTDSPFAGNGSRVGSGAVPLPPAPL